MSDKIHVARLKKGGQKFEVAIDPDKALAFRQGKILDLKEALRDIHIFTDAQRGIKPPEELLKSAFGTTDDTEIARIIVLKGELQLTAQMRSNMHEAKKRQILDMLHLWGVDPRTKAPHPVSRLEAAFEEARITIDESRTPQEQITEIVKNIQTILPIKIEKKNIKITIPPAHAHAAYGKLKRMASIRSEQWLSDGSWEGIVEIPGGMEQTLLDTLNSITHGELIATHIER